MIYAHPPLGPYACNHAPSVFLHVITFDLGLCRRLFPCGLLHVVCMAFWLPLQLLVAGISSFAKILPINQRKQLIAKLKGSQCPSTIHPTPCFMRKLPKPESGGSQVKMRKRHNGVGPAQTKTRWNGGERTRRKHCRREASEIDLADPNLGHLSFYGWQAPCSL